MALNLTISAPFGPPRTATYHRVAETTDHGGYLSVIVAGYDSADARQADIGRVVTMTEHVIDGAAYKPGMELPAVYRLLKAGPLAGAKDC